MHIDPDDASAFQSSVVFAVFATGEIENQAMAKARNSVYNYIVASIKGSQVEHLPETLTTRGDVSEIFYAIKSDALNCSRTETQFKIDQFLKKDWMECPNLAVMIHRMEQEAYFLVDLGKRVGLPTTLSPDQYRTKPVTWVMNQNTGMADLERKVEVIRELEKHKPDFKPKELLEAINEERKSYEYYKAFIGGRPPVNSLQPIKAHLAQEGGEIPKLDKGKEQILQEMIETRVREEMEKLQVVSQGTAQRRELEKRALAASLQGECWGPMRFGKCDRPRCPFQHTGAKVEVCPKCGKPGHHQKDCWDHLSC